MDDDTLKVSMRFMWPVIWQLRSHLVRHPFNGRVSNASLLYYRTLDLQWWWWHWWWLLWWWWNCPVFAPIPYFVFFLFCIAIVVPIVVACCCCCYCNSFVPLSLCLVAKGRLFAIVVMPLILLVPTDDDNQSFLDIGWTSYGRSMSALHRERDKCQRNDSEWIQWRLPGWLTGWLTGWLATLTKMATVDQLQQLRVLGFSSVSEFTFYLKFSLVDLSWVEFSWVQLNSVQLMPSGDIHTYVLIVPESTDMMMVVLPVT